MLVIILIAAAFGWWPRQPSLVEIQKEYLLARTEIEKRQAVGRLEKYYEMLPVPEALSQNLEREVTKLCESTSLDITECTRKASLDNPYGDEEQLQCFVKLAMISKVRDQPQEFHQYQQQAESLAKSIDQITHTCYWPRFVDNLKSPPKK